MYDGLRVYDGHRVYIIWQKYTQKPKKLFFSAPVRARMVLNAFLECMHLAETWIRRTSHTFEGDRKFRYIFDIYRRNKPGILTLVLNVENVENIL